MGISLKMGQLGDLKGKKIKGFAFCFFGMATGDMINLSSPRGNSEKGEQT